MARWGNALGGWRKQKRNAKGQFGGGSGRSKKRAVRKTARKTYRRETKSIRSTHRAASKASAKQTRADFKKRTTALQRANPYSIKRARATVGVNIEHQQRMSKPNKKALSDQTKAINKKRAAYGKKKLTQKEVRNRNARRAAAVGIAAGVAVAVAQRQAIYEANLEVYYRQNKFADHGWTRKNVRDMTGGGPVGAAMRGAAKAGPIMTKAKNTPSALKGILTGEYRYQSTTVGGAHFGAWTNAPRTTRGRALPSRGSTFKQSKKRRGAHNITTAKKRGKATKNNGHVYVGVVI